MLLNIPGKYIFEQISTKYTDSAAIRALIAILPIAFQSDIPNAALLAPVVDTTLVTLFQQHRIHRQKLLHDKLNDGSVVLEEDAIKNDAFIHSYLQTVQYVDRARTDKKVERFAQILKSLYRDDINIDQFEYYSKVLDEITDLEFALLLIKLSFEDHEYLRDVGKVSREKWEEFTNSACTQLQITPDSLSDLLVRLQGSGCYIIRSTYGGPPTIGNTTNLFRELVKTVS